MFRLEKESLSSWNPALSKRSVYVPVRGGELEFMESSSIEKERVCSGSRRRA